MAPAARMKMGAKVWVKDVDVHNPDVFVMATLKGVKGRMCEVETEKGDAFDTDTYFPANPPNQDQNDHTALLHLSDATLLANTKMRYAKDEIYTFVGPILVSVNPFKYIAKLYEPELMATCKKFQPGHPERPAHTFSMAEAAYQQMKKEKRHQSLVVSGESGAGKTEVNKQCMNYLVWRASGADGATSLSTRILQSNPILEGLGNAKTVRNNNSSRFGKFVTMRFDENDEKTYRRSCATTTSPRSRPSCSRSRASSPRPESGERNYHVFYHVAKARRRLRPRCCRFAARTRRPSDGRLLPTAAALARSGTLTKHHFYIGDEKAEIFGSTTRALRRSTHVIIKAMRDIGVAEGGDESRRGQQAIAAAMASRSATSSLATRRTMRRPTRRRDDPDRCARSARRHARARRRG